MLTDERRTLAPQEARLRAYCGMRGDAGAMLCGLALTLLGLAFSPLAWSSYGQMKITGLMFVLATALLYLWCGLLVLPLALKWAERKAVVIAATAVTGLLVSLVIAFIDDGRAAMSQRPLNEWGMFVVLLLAAVPVMLLAPALQLALRVRGVSSRLPLVLAASAFVLIPAGSAAHGLLQVVLLERTHARALALPPGRILPHVIESKERAARSWLSPYLWNEEAELKWIMVGVGRLSFIDSPAPIAEEDTKAILLLVKLSEGTDNANYTWKLEGKLVWDRLMRAADVEKFAVAAGLTRPQAGQFAKYIGEEHADWLCAPLANPETRQAIGHVWSLLSENDGRQFSKEVREKCGTAIEVPPQRTGIRTPGSASRQGQVTAVPPRPASATGR